MRESERADHHSSIHLSPGSRTEPGFVSPQMADERQSSYPADSLPGRSILLSGGKRRLWTSLHAPPAEGYVALRAPAAPWCLICGFYYSFPQTCRPEILRSLIFHYSVYYVDIIYLPGRWRCDTTLLCLPFLCKYLLFFWRLLACELPVRGAHGISKKPRAVSSRPHLKEREVP